MTEFRIAVLPGDGIGPDVIAETVRVLRAVEARLSGVQFSLSEHAVGAAEYLRGVDPLPESAFEACRNSDAVLLGAMGLPDVRWPNGKGIANPIATILSAALMLDWLKHPECPLGGSLIRRAVETVLADPTRRNRWHKTVGM